MVILAGGAEQQGCDRWAEVMRPIEYSIIFIRSPQARNKYEEK